MKGAKVFVDTNVLIRGTISTAPYHQEAAKHIFERIDQGIEMWISRQIVREYIAQVTRPQKFMEPLPYTQLELQINSLYGLFKIADETASVTSELLKLIKVIPTGGKQIHDANIVATMLTYNIDTLITQNMEDMKRFDGKITLVPLI